MNSTLSVLIVEADTPAYLTLYGSLRKRYDESGVVRAATCAQARRLVAKQDFDCVFVSYHLPDGLGLGCLLDMRDAGVTAPIVMLTGPGEEAIAAEMIKAGATDYLPVHEVTPGLIDHCIRGAIRYQQSQVQVQLRDRAIAAAKNGIVICDPNAADCPIVYCNPAFVCITGYSMDEVIGRNCRFLQGPDSDPEMVKLIEVSLKKKLGCQVVLKNYRKDGTSFWNELVISPVHDSGGRLTHFIGIITDITERKNIEDALRLNVERQRLLLRDMFSSVTQGKLTLCTTQDDLPIERTCVGDSIELTAPGGIRELRRRTLIATTRAGLSEQRRYDLETAVGEAGMNAVVHTHSGVGAVYYSPGMVQVRVVDSGKGIPVEDLPNAALRRGYSTISTFGHGFKMVLETVDRVFLLTGGSGTTIVLEQDQLPVSSVW